MIKQRSLTYWSVIIVFLALTAGCLHTKQLQETPLSTTAKAPPLPLAPSTSDHAIPTSVASTNQQLVSGKLNCKSPQTQAAINTCAIVSAEAADKRLNQIYQQLRAALKGTKREKLLIDAELKWVKFRDTNCAFERSDYEGGSIASFIYYSCIEQMTKQRTKELEGYLRNSNEK